MADPLTSNPLVIPFQIGDIGQGFIPAPAFNAQGQFNPSLMAGAQQYARSQTNYAKDILSRRGAWDSSMAAPLMQRAFRGGFNDMTNLFQNQQSMYGNIAGQLMQGLAAAGPESSMSKIMGEGSWLGNLLTNPLGVGEGGFLGISGL